MRLIAHRGLLYGPDPKAENTPQSINTCLELGIDVEIDVWYTDGWMLGHDAPSIRVTTDFLTQQNLWIHAKNAKACQELSQLHHLRPMLNYFWHENDERVLTSQNYWWTSPNKPLFSNSIAVMPEWHTPLDKLAECLSWDAFAICSDWISLLHPVGAQ